MEINKILNFIFVLFVFSLLLGCSSTIDIKENTIPLFPEKHGWDLKQFTISDNDNNFLNFKRVDCVWVVGNGNNPSDERPCQEGESCGHYSDTRPRNCQNG